MRILAALPLYPPASRVGAWLATHACLSHMTQRGHHVDVVTRLSTGYAYDLDGVHVHPGASMDAFDRPDVVLSHLGDDHAADGWAFERLVPSVRMVHGSSPENAAHLAATRPALAVYNSESLACEVGHPGIVVRPPFDPEDVRTTPGPMVTLVNLAEAKGGALFWELARSMPEAQFLGVRGGYGLQVSNKSKNATVIAPTMDMANDVYGRTRILLMPSERETWGMVGVEAMCSGIPVIAHPTPGLRESLGDAGIFLDRADVEGWRSAIRSLLDAPSWAAASARASARRRTRPRRRSGSLCVGHRGPGAGEGCSMTAAALVVMTDGRRECIERSVPAALENLKGLDVGPLVICDDSGVPEYRAWLAETFPAATLVTSPDRTGYAEAVRRAWAAALDADTPWVFWLEDDFIVERPVDLAAMAEVLTSQPHLTQLVLKRQPWWGNEVAAGGIIECNPEAFRDRSDGTHQWVEHTEGHWSNPHLVAREFLATHEWPTGAWSESRFGAEVLVGGRASAFWGHSSDAPLVEHVGERRGTGY
ncbi:glycosyltransferase [Aquihabitans sp. G128]|uniref:glycosyltransferase n=1 Tax=Aquihabitans sp. G128 TaxID=2849779 RepID=UPI001C23F9A8|nr:glycosyltransferase [Aquihabitans sp. G128]QXC59334.1 glycosyltransferase [Aquihabitans sp. G128]